MRKAQEILRLETTRCIQAKRIKELKTAKIIGTQACGLLKVRIVELEADNKQLRKQIGDLRAKAVRKGLMNKGCFTGKT